MGRPATDLSRLDTSRVESSREPDVSCTVSDRGIAADCWEASCYVADNVVHMIEYTNENRLKGEHWTKDLAKQFS